MNTAPESTEAERRYLEATCLLKLTVFVALIPISALLWFIIYIFWPDTAGLLMLLAAIAVMVGLGSFSWALADAVSQGIAARAGRNGAQPSLLFTPNVTREKRAFGPLRAHRKFGHPIGRKRPWWRPAAQPADEADEAPRG